MTFFKYLQDVKGIFLSWIMFVLGTLLLIWLYPGFQLTWDFSWYFICLEGLVLLLFLGISYGKKRDYYKQLQEMEDNIYLEHTDHFVTNEEKLVLETLEKIKNTYSLSAEMAKEKQLDHQVYLDTWVHEIKIPLAALSLIWENLKEDIPEKRYYQIENELRKINDYVEQVLYVSRLDNFAKDYVIHEYSMEKIVQENLKNFVNYFLAKHLKLEIIGDDFSVLTDEKYLGYVIRQILGNSIKYTPENGKITIEFKPGEFYDDLIITDTGVGILKEDLPRIFAKGFTGENGRNQQKSTGLGLYLAKELTDKLSHTLLITSPEMKGTIATLRFFHLDDLRLEN